LDLYFEKQIPGGRPVISIISGVNFIALGAGQIYSFLQI